jgi:formylmethanofuran dehydrogenase subunit E
VETITHEPIAFETNLELFNTLVNAGFILHGHICPAMPLGIRAALEAMQALGVGRARNKELHVIMENGPSHAALCFSEGVQMGTSATFGKGEITRTNEGKNAFSLIDKKTGKGLRVSINYGFFEKMMNSEFVNKRKAGIEPYNIDRNLPITMIQNMLRTPTEAIFSISDITTYELPSAKGSFNYYQCTRCKEPLYEPGVRLRDNEFVCISCSE